MPGFAQFNLLIALERDVDCSWDQQLHTMLGSHYPTKLLLIDDGPDVPQFLRIIEGSSDLACTATADTVQASKLALRDQPHIILMDTALPTGDGLPLLAWLRRSRHTRDIPIIVATARPTPELDAWVQVKGGVKLIQKPCVKEVVLDLLQQLLEHHVRASSF